MNKHLFPFYLFAVIVIVPLFGMEELGGAGNSAPYTLEQRRRIAQDIIASDLSPVRLQEIARQFECENQCTLAWFENHKQSLMVLLAADFPDIEMKVMGSRYWHTNHMLSDIDAVVVAKAENHETVLDLLQQWYSVHYPGIKQIRKKTKTGLPLFALKTFNDAQLGEMRLEYILQSPEADRATIEGLRQRLAQRFKTDQDKTRYAIAMMQAVYQNDEKAQLELKGWTRLEVKEWSLLRTLRTNGE